MANKRKKAKTLVIVESPTKCKTINKYLGKDYVLASSMGHIIDLPKSRLAVNVEHNFEPEYITIRGKAKILNDLRRKAASAECVLLATDPDREGEAISWHLERVLSLKNPNIKRIEFNEITETAVREAINHPREINQNLVNAQQARRILDRLVGYSLSPILWKKVKKGLSAGRVQSVVLKEICNRESQIDRFVPDEYWTVDVEYKVKNKKYLASLVAKGKDKLKPSSQEEVDQILAELKDEEFIVESITKKERKRKPLAPYITSKLQQDAANKLGFTSFKTMVVAQQLYEGIEVTGVGPVGLITYMRTDSTRISDLALTAVRNYIQTNYSEEYLPEKVNIYTNKKGAQDAHEAIRPSDVNLTPEQLKKDLTKDQYKLYKLIWSRFVASQMTNEISEVGTVNIKAGEYKLRTSGSKILFPGFATLDTGKKKKDILPVVKEGDVLNLNEFLPEQHFTTPPPRFTDASLVKFLEETGVGRPSTYAPTINTLIKRYYVSRSGRQLVPTVLGKLVNELIVDNFDRFITTEFTSNMEVRLDNIEEGREDWIKMLGDFYPPFIHDVEVAESQIKDLKGSLDEPTDLICEKCGSPMVKKLGKFGYFLACSGFPDCRNAKSLPLGKCPAEGCDGDVVKRSSKKGRPFYACSNYPDCTFITREIPSDKSCPKCGSLLFKRKIRGKGEKLICLHEGCDYSIELLDE